MFKDIYKAANDDIKADRALLEKVLRQKKRKKPPVLKYSSIAAACAAVAICLAVSPSWVEKDESKVDYSEPSVPTAAPVAETVTENTQELSEVKADAKPNIKSEIKPNVKPDTKPNAVSEPIKESAAAKTREMAADDMSSEKLSAIVPESAEEKVNTEVKTVVLHVNSYDYGGSSMDEGADEEITTEGSVYTTVDWTLDDYFEYLGENVLEKVSLPPDFSYIGDTEMTVSVDENGVPAQDSRIFPYEGENGRYVSVITSKDTLTSRSYLEDTRYLKSDIEGNDAVVIGGEEEYKSYMISNDVSHIITSDGVTEDELADMLVSIGG